MSIFAVFDAMIFLQQAAQPHRLHATFQAVYDGRVTLCLSPALLGEIQDVLNRPTLRAKFPALNPAAVETFIDDLYHRARFFFPVPNAFSLPHHPDDNHILNLAIHAPARYLITWETRLLALSTSSNTIALQFRQLAPSLTLLTPPQLVAALASDARP